MYLCRLIILCLLLAALTHPSQVTANPIKRAFQRCIALTRSGHYDNSDVLCSIHHIYSRTRGSPFHDIEPKLKTLLNKSQLREKRNLSESEITAIFAYTHRAYRFLNKHLRTGEPIPEDFEPFLGAIGSGLQKVEPFTGTLYRTANLKEIRALEMEKGKIIQYDAFLSTSFRNPLKANTLYEGLHYFKIGSKSGRPIEELSLFPSEKEVLFSPGTTFEVVVEPQEDGSECQARFLLKEVDDPESLSESPPDDPPFSM
jgi:hypothetical protein